MQVHRRKLFAFGLMGAGLVVLAGLPRVLAQGGFTPLPSLDVRETWARQQRGELVLVDIRTPEEWADTGIPAGAVRLDMRAPDFEARLADLRRRNPGREIALICATAGRTSAVQRSLAQRGIAVTNVEGGMFGSFFGRGWRDERLPVTDGR